MLRQNATGHYQLFADLSLFCFNGSVHSSWHALLKFVQYLMIYFQVKSIGVSSEHMLQFRD